MFQNQYNHIISYSKCTNCCLKPATLKCQDCDKLTLLCLKCDNTIHEHKIKHIRSVIDYDQIKDKKHLSQENSRILIDSLQNTSNLMEYTLTSEKRNMKQTESIRSQLSQSIEPLEIKYKIKLQEQENRINVLKNHIERIENNYETNLNTVRDEKIKLESKFIEFKEQLEDQQRQLQIEYESKINHILMQLDTEKEKNENLSNQIENEQKKHEQIRDKFNKEQLKMQQEKEQYMDYYQEKEQQLQHQLEQLKKQTENETLDLTNRLSNTMKQNNQESRDQIKLKTEHINSQNLQIQQLIENLQRANQEILKLQDKQIQIQKEKNEDIDQLKFENEQLNHQIEMHQEALKLQANEVITHQLTIQELTEQREKLDRKIEKYERIIYGGKKRNSEKSQH